MSFILFVHVYVCKHSFYLSLSEILIPVDVLLAKLLSIDTCSMIQYRNTSSAEVQDTDFFPSCPLVLILTLVCSVLRQQSTW